MNQKIDRLLKLLSQNFLWILLHLNSSQSHLTSSSHSGQFLYVLFLDPDAEVIVLSPKTLLVTNRFVCEICSKAFKRDQDLQLHRRGHNLPWKLKQRSGKQINKKVYVCSEWSCIHHDSTRALGDLIGIKKHYCRKNGEKKWKCDKCKNLERYEGIFRSMVNPIILFMVTVDVFLNAFQEVIPAFGAYTDDLERCKYEYSPTEGFL